METIDYDMSSENDFEKCFDMSIHKGTIVTVDSINDECKVLVQRLTSEGGSIEVDKVPIFYHCEGTDEVKGGSSAFSTGDKVYVINEKGECDSDATTLKVVGFIDGLRPCIHSCIRARLKCKFEKKDNLGNLIEGIGYNFIWDFVNDCYAQDIPKVGGGYFVDEDWPVTDDELAKFLEWDERISSNLYIEGITEEGVYGAWEPVDTQDNAYFIVWVGDDPADWTVENEDANNYITKNPGKNEAIVIGNGGTLDFFQDIGGMENGKTYRVYFDVEEYTNGDLYIELSADGGSQPILGKLVEIDGTGSFYVEFVYNSTGVLDLKLKIFAANVILILNGIILMKFVTNANHCSNILEDCVDGNPNCIINLPCDNECNGTFYLEDGVTRGDCHWKCLSIWAGVFPGEAIVDFEKASDFLWYQKFESQTDILSFCYQAADNIYTKDQHEWRGPFFDEVYGWSKEYTSWNWRTPIGNVEDFSQEFTETEFKTASMWDPPWDDYSKSKKRYGYGDLDRLNQCCMFKKGPDHAMIQIFLMSYTLYDYTEYSHWVGGIWVTDTITEYGTEWKVIAACDRYDDVMNQDPCQQTKNNILITAVENLVNGMVTKQGYSFDDYMVHYELGDLTTAFY